MIPAIVLGSPLESFTKTAKRTVPALFATLLLYQHLKSSVELKGPHGRYLKSSGLLTVFETNCSVC